MYARGVFERTQRLVLMSDDSEGVVTGMDMTFAGFAIGTVARIELAEDGNVRILVDVPTKDAKWLRSSSIFTMEKALVGGTKIRAYSGVLSDPPLEDGAVRQVLRGDAAAEFPKLLAQVRDLLDNLNGLTREGAPLSRKPGQPAGRDGHAQRPAGRHGHGVWQRGRCPEDRDHDRSRQRGPEPGGPAGASGSMVWWPMPIKQVFGASGKAAWPASGGLVNDARATVQQLNAVAGRCARQPARRWTRCWWRPRALPATPARPRPT